MHLTLVTTRYSILDKITIRFSRKTSRSRGKLFYCLVQQAVAIRPVTGQEISGGWPLWPTTTYWGYGSRMHSPIDQLTQKTEGDILILRRSASRISGSTWLPCTWCNCRECQWNGFSYWICQKYPDRHKIMCFYPISQEVRIGWLWGGGPNCLEGASLKKYWEGYQYGLNITQISEGDHWKLKLLLDGQFNLNGLSYVLYRDSRYESEDRIPQTRWDGWGKTTSFIFSDDHQERWDGNKTIRR